MNFHNATLTELYTITYHDSIENAPVHLKMQAAAEIARRKQQTRKPYRVNQQKVRIQYPK
jgi:lysine/ornithine N-monooxygenase